MTYDDMADFHQHMSAWCEEEAERFRGLPRTVMRLRRDEHDEAFQYWCRMANPAPPEDAE